MMTTPLTCDSFAEHLGEYLEGDATPAVRAAMDAHRAECPACGAMLQAIDDIRVEAAALPSLVPSHDLWSGIAARIETPVTPLSVGAPRSGAGAAQRRSTGLWWKHPAVAAAALVGITAGVTHYATREALEVPLPAATVAIPRELVPTVSGTGVIVDRSPERVATVEGSSASTATSTPEAGPSDERPPAHSDVAAAVQFVAAGGAPVGTYRSGNAAALDSLYYREILRLRQALDQRTTKLDSTTVEVLDRNMRVIDQAIRECREALAADPASRFLNQQLNEALESKIELLRTAAMMPIGT